MNAEAKLYQLFFNKIVINELIQKLKIDSTTARSLHKETWAALDINNYNPARMNYVHKYIELLFHNLCEYINELNHKVDGIGSRLEEIAFNDVFDDNTDNLKEIKRRWAFLWQFIDRLKADSKKIFLYKLYGNLSFNSIALIMNMSEEKIKDIYFKAEKEILNDKKFREYFFIQKDSGRHE